jgi:hypothetical protein
MARRKTPLYEFHVSWLYLDGEDPERRLLTIVEGLSVPHALTRFYRDMAEEYGKSRSGFCILEVANMSIT